MTTTASQEAFLHAFHAEHPAVTAQAFGAGRAPDGRSSYEILCDRVAGSSRVLDLGCGDGLLLEFLARSDGSVRAGRRGQGWRGIRPLHRAVALHDRGVARLASHSVAGGPTDPQP
ncbi:methionine biosynthesis protein MetW [Streptomyces sp. NPDC059582]|uniref:methionine biosynthesis protein MetW n=1 Tax=Streptomyces sp. NPDC059582 TaxID=3346875 RepID=UPI00369D3ED4